MKWFKGSQKILWSGCFLTKRWLKTCIIQAKKGSYLFQCCNKFSISRWDQRRKVILTSASLVSTTFIIFRYAVSRSFIREGSSDSTKRNSKLIRFIIKIVKLKKNIKQTKKPTKNKKAKKKKRFLYHQSWKLNSTLCSCKWVRTRRRRVTFSFLWGCESHKHSINIVFKYLNIILKTSKTFGIFNIWVYTNPFFLKKKNISWEKIQKAEKSVRF